MQREKGIKQRRKVGRKRGREGVNGVEADMI